MDDITKAVMGHFHLSIPFPTALTHRSVIWRTIDLEYYYELKLERDKLRIYEMESSILAHETELADPNGIEKMLSFIGRRRMQLHVPHLERMA